MQHYNQVPFRELETSLRDRAGSDLQRAALIYLKGDLAEFGATLGFPTTATQQHPCMLCNCTHSNMADTCGWDSVTSQHRKHVWEDYVRACEACEHWRNLSAAEHEALLIIVEWDKRNGRQEWLAKDYRRRKISLRSASKNMIE